MAGYLLLKQVARAGEGKVLDRSVGQPPSCTPCAAPPALTAPGSTAKREHPHRSLSVCLGLVLNVSVAHRLMAHKRATKARPHVLMSTSLPRCSLLLPAGISAQPGWFDAPRSGEAGLGERGSSWSLGSVDTLVFRHGPASPADGS